MSETLYTKTNDMKVANFKQQFLELPSKEQNTVINEMKKDFEAGAYKDSPKHRKPFYELIEWCLENTN